LTSYTKLSNNTFKEVEKMVMSSSEELASLLPAESSLFNAPKAGLYPNLNFYLFS